MIKKILFISFLMLSSCSHSIPSFEQAFMCIGMDKDQMISYFGIPEKTYFSSNIEVWEYSGDISVLSSGVTTEVGDTSIYVSSFTGTVLQHRILFFIKDDEVVGFKSN